MECWDGMLAEDPDYWDKLWASTLAPISMLVAAITFQLGMVGLGWAKRIDQGVAIKIVLMVLFFTL